jgi:hypothetical protein
MFQFPAFAPVRLCIQRQVTPRLSGPRFRIQKSPDRCLIASSPEHIAGFHVFRRLSMPRHPPYTLKSLTTFIDHRHGICDCRLPICDWKSQTDFRRLLIRTGGRAGAVASPLRACRSTGSARSITNQIAKKVLDDICPKPTASPDETFEALDFQTEDTYRADIAEVYCK